MNQCFSPSLSSSFPLFLKINKYNLKKTKKERKTEEQLPNGFSRRICSEQELAGAPPERSAWFVLSSPSDVLLHWGFSISFVTA